MILLSAVSSLRLYYPDFSSASFATSHYLGPLIPALVLSLLAGFIYRGRRDRSAFVSRLQIKRLRSVLALLVIVYIHFNLKLWAQLVNRHLFDDVYHRIDLEYFSVIQFMESINEVMTKSLHFWPNAYHDLFVAMFLISFAAHAVQRSEDIFDQLVLAVALVLVIGGMAYALAPAWGPFIYEHGTNPFATDVQSYMSDFQRKFIMSGGTDFEPRYFIAPLAAMPSLHIGHLAVFLWFAWRYLPTLGLIYLLPALFIVTESVTAKWHYLVDLPVGIGLAALCILLAHKLTDAQRHQLCAAN